MLGLETQRGENAAPDHAGDNQRESRKKTDAVLLSVHPNTESISNPKAAPLATPRASWLPTGWLGLKPQPHASKNACSRGVRPRLHVPIDLQNLRPCEAVRCRAFPPRWQEPKLRLEPNCRPIRLPRRSRAIAPQ